MRKASIIILVLLLVGCSSIDKKTDALVETETITDTEIIRDITKTEYDSEGKVKNITNITESERQTEKTDIIETIKEERIIKKSFFERFAMGIISAVLFCVGVVIIYIYARLKK